MSERFLPVNGNILTRSSVCACAARIDEHYFKIYPALVEVARTCAGNALVQGKKTVADCQAFLLCAVYQTPKKKWEDQRGWLYMGIAFTYVYVWGR